MSLLEFFGSSRIAIAGLGKEGRSTLRFLLGLGIPESQITLLDANENLEVAGFGGQKIVGKSYLDTLDEFDVIFRTPGMSPFLTPLGHFQGRLLTQTSLFYQFYTGKIISVTQTKGKSTTVSLVYDLLKHAGYKVKLVGNIGSPVLDEIDGVGTEYDFVVYELSSYMLQDLSNHHSYISLFGNLYPDHLDWHAGFANYARAKSNIVKNSEHLFVGTELAGSHSELFEHKAFHTFGNEGDYTYDGVTFTNSLTNHTLKASSSLLGSHNHRNLAGIFAVKELLGIEDSVFAHTIASFQALPHRMERVGTFGGISFVDDAISTTPESTMEALKTFFTDIETIFLGGTDRGYDFSELSEMLMDSGVKNIVLFRDSGARIKALLPEGRFEVFETDDMKKAVDFARMHTTPGKMCLLSTASPSYSIWKNYEEKGDLFQKYARDLE